jgi:hypothetical protein
VLIKYCYIKKNLTICLLMQVVNYDYKFDDISYNEINYSTFSRTNLKNYPKISLIYYKVKS